MLTGLDHSAISLGQDDLEVELEQNGDPTTAATSTWIHSEEAPLFSSEDLETLEGQAAGDARASTS